MSSRPDNSEADQPIFSGAEVLGVSSTQESTDLSQTFTLIDGILPFEACLYHQVLPIAVEGSRLYLGMVSPGDQTALEYVRRQISYINYSVIPQAIPSDWHREILSKYLSHMAKAKHKKQAAVTGQSSPADAQATLVVDYPDQLESERDQPSPSEASAPAKPPAKTPAAATTPSLSKSDPAAADTPSDGKAAEVATPQTTTPSPLPGQSAGDNDQATDPSAPAATPSAPLHLQLNATYQQADPDTLAQLPPKELMQALLARVLAEGIGRLYFERRSQEGRILWSKDGVLQSVLNSVPSSVFQAVINELKLLTHISLIPVSKPKQVEVERLYQQDRVLLRFRVMPSKHGEEATLQVLRGMALKFHQQQQIDKLGRDALTIAQDLQIRLNEIRSRGHHSLNTPHTRNETLPAIIQLLKQMERQVKEMMTANQPEEPSDPFQ
ncbi:uncharacterized protein XM38_051630 [Halomicronema hongdechloris C2206]|uniref:Uncharacterized protein n=1 Tax=Halomicronema hongdechloris C2206 TaxID=1641165 RepID=A0A1Z3HV49_9CYAN|nr:hypothetical protein [Halomicronema hongdechloris]ASC74188.1 uncharacterized protein XM38_051630 [Halomicronema hongdechloris C2206]